jgi:hypothetical protein
MKRVTQSSSTPFSAPPFARPYQTAGSKFHDGPVVPEKSRRILIEGLAGAFRRNG